MDYAGFSFFDITNDASTSFRLFAFKKFDSSRNATNICGNRLRLLYKLFNTRSATDSLGFVIDKLGVRVSAGLAFNPFGVIWFP